MIAIGSRNRQRRASASIMGGVHCLVIVYLLIATDVSNGGNTHHGGSTVLSSALPVSSTVSTATSTAVATSNAPPTFVSRNNSRYIGLVTTTSTFTSSSSSAASTTTPATISSILLSSNSSSSSSISNSTSSSSNSSSSSSTSRDRDNKLMSVLHARRSALTIPARDSRWRDKQIKDIVNGRGLSACDRQCSNEARFTSRECLRNCLTSATGGARHTSRFNQTRHNNIVMNVRNTHRSRQQDESTPEMNLIANTNDELLETDESIKGEVTVHPQASTGGSGRRNSQNTFQSQPTKETLRRASNKTELSRNKPYKFEPISNVVETSRPMATTKAVIYEFTTKHLDRTPRIQNKVLTSNRTETDSESYVFFGEKIPAASKSSVNQVTENRRSKIKHEPLEIVIEPLPKIASTEKNRTWKNRNLASRNVVAYNNYLRRMNPETTTTKVIIEVSSTSDGATYKYQTIHPDTRMKAKLRLTNLTSSTMASIYNLAEGEVDAKVVHSRSAENTTEAEKVHLPADTQIVTQKTLPTKPVQSFITSEKAQIFQPSRRPSLIISIPENATPEGVFFSDSPVQKEGRGRGSSVYVNPLFYHTGATEPVSPHTEIVRITEANHVELEDPRNQVSLPDINHIFPNISSFSLPARGSNRDTVIVVVPGQISSSTSKSVSRTTISTSVKAPNNPQDEVSTTTVGTRIVADTEQRTTSSSTSVGSSTTTATTTSTTTTRRPVTTTTTTEKSTTRTPTTKSKITSTTAKTVEELFTISPTAFLDINQLAETTEVNVFHEVVPDPSFKPILSSIFPNLSEPTPRTMTDVNFSVFMASSNATGQNKKPLNAVFDGTPATTNNDVMIEMHKVNTATLVLAALGMLPVVIVLLYAVRTLLIRRKHKAQHDLERYISDGQPISPVVKLEQSETSSTTTESIMSDKDFDRSNLRFKSLLGEGNFGQVWKAEADDLAGHLGTTRIVAVKTERVDNGQGGLKAEAEIMKKLGSHPNVVTLLGACTEQEPHLLIMEFAMRGRLLSLLRAARSAINEVTVKRTPVMPLSLRRLTGFAHDIARGMEYISDKKIVHRDLAARNVLLDHNGICKICDFGMSVDLDKVATSHSELRIPRLHQTEPRFNFEFAGRTFGTRSNRQALSHCNTRTTRPALPIRWMAPEALQYHIYSPETDVWAFGIVIWEIATLGCTPYPNLSGREVVRSIPNGVRPDIPPDCRPELYELMNRTWRKDPRNRPTFAEARMALARALCQWKPDDNVPATGSEYFDVSGFSEDLEHGMVYFNKRVSEFECEI